MKKFNALITLSCFIFGLFLQSLLAQNTSPKPTIFQRITREEGAKLTLEADLTTLSANRKSNDYFPGSLTLEDGQQFKVEVRPRGKYRRRIAEIPPLKIKFKKKSLTALGLDTLNELKLVLPCYNNEMGDELVVKEYLVYRMFEVVAGASMKARLVRVNLRDVHVESSSRRSVMGILVEDEEEAAVRLGGRLIDQFGIATDSLVTNQVAMVCMFQYMVGNTDWDISMNRNVRFVQSPLSHKVMVLPYDFDFAGIVAAPYASPASESGLKSVRDRFLMSNGLKVEALRRATQILKASKKEILEACRSKYLSREAQEDMHAYLESFFRHVEDRDEVAPMLKLGPAE